VHVCNEQKCAENNAMHSIYTDIKHKPLNVFVFRMKYNDDDTIELALSRPCSSCRNMLRAIGRKGIKIKIKWSTGDINNLVTPYIDINDFKYAVPTSGTLKRYSKLLKY
jgi:cytidine deaminase